MPSHWGTAFLFGALLVLATALPTELTTTLGPHIETEYQYNDVITAMKTTNTRERMMTTFHQLALLKEDQHSVDLHNWSASVDPLGQYRGEKAFLVLYLNFQKPMEDDTEGPLLSSQTVSQMLNGDEHQLYASPYTSQPLHSIRWHLKANASDLLSTYFYVSEVDLPYEAQPKLDQIVKTLMTKINAIVPEIQYRKVDGLEWATDTRFALPTDREEIPKMRIMVFHNHKLYHDDGEHHINTKYVHRVSIHSLAASKLMPGPVLSHVARFLFDLDEGGPRDQSALALGPLGTTALLSSSRKPWSSWHQCLGHSSLMLYPPLINAADRVSLGWAEPHLVNEFRMLHLKEESTAELNTFSVKRVGVFLPAVHRLRFLQNLEVSALLKRTDFIYWWKHFYVPNKGTQIHNFGDRDLNKITEQMMVSRGFNEMVIFDIVKHYSRSECDYDGGGVAIYQIDPAHSGGTDDRDGSMIQLMHSNMRTDISPGERLLFQAPSMMPIDAMNDSFARNYHISRFHRENEMLRLDQMITMRSDLNLPGTNSIILKVVPIAFDDDHTTMKGQDLCAMSIEARCVGEECHDRDTTTDMTCINECKAIFASPIYQHHCFKLGYDTNNVGCVADCVVSMMDECQVVENAPKKCHRGCDKALSPTPSHRRRQHSNPLGTSNAVPASDHQCTNECHSMMDHPLYWSDSCRLVDSSYAPGDAHSVAGCYVGLFGEDHCRLQKTVVLDQVHHMTVFILLSVWLIMSISYVPSYVTNKAVARKEEKYKEILENFKLF